MCRDVHDVLVCLGYGLNAVCSKVLKEILAQPRPRDTCSILGTCDSHGMPSTHSQFMMFCASYALCHYLYNRRVVRSMKRKKKTFEEMRVISTITVVEHTILWILALSVCIARVHLGYHSVSQVVVGGILGIVCGYLWYLYVHYRYNGGILCRFVRIMHGPVLLTNTQLCSEFD